MKRMNHTRRGAGFSLAEALVAMLILLMATSIVAAGIPVAVRAYRSVVDSANAQLVLSTAMTKLREELSVAGDVENPTRDGAADTTAVTFQSSLNYPAEIYLEAGAGIRINQNTTDAEGKYDDLLISKAASNKNLHVTYDGIVYADGVVTVSGLRVEKDGDDTALTDELTFKIRVLTAS